MIESIVSSEEAEESSQDTDVEIQEGSSSSSYAIKALNTPFIQPEPGSFL
jgi:hypothetical protein